MLLKHSLMVVLCHADWGEDSKVAREVTCLRRLSMILILLLQKNNAFVRFLNLCCLLADDTRYRLPPSGQLRRSCLILTFVLILVVCLTVFGVS